MSCGLFRQLFGLVFEQVLEGLLDDSLDCFWFVNNCWSTFWTIFGRFFEQFFGGFKNSASFWITVASIWFILHPPIFFSINANEKEVYLTEMQK